MTEPTQPVCTVCIANYNGESLLIDCIDSVLNQQCNFAFDIIVHDDASTDNSLELLATRYPQVKVIASQCNVGFCVSNNRMVEVATGQFILLLNNDAALTPDALETLHKHAMQQSTQGILTLPQYDWESGALVDRGCLLDPFYNPVPNLDPNRREVAMVIGACFWIPRTLWVELGGFPEWFESIAEDMQVCCHARLAKFTVEVTRQSGYRHRQGICFGGNRVQAGQLRTTYRRRRLSESNKTFVMLLCTPGCMLCLLLPLHLTLLAIEGIAVSLLRFDWRLLKEVYWNVPRTLIKMRRQLGEKRSSIQRYGIISLHHYFQPFTWLPHKLRMLLRHGMPRVS